MNSGEPEVEQVRDGEERLSEVEQLGRLERRGVELIESVDLHELDASALVDLAGAHPRKHPFHHSVRPGVTIMERVVEERAALAQQSVINPPRVDSNAVQLAAVDRARESERLLHLQPEPRHVPMQLSVVGNRLVRKPVDLLDRQRVRL